jgi:hypothetical protein
VLAWLAAHALIAWSLRTGRRAWQCLLIPGQGKADQVRARHAILASPLPAARRDLVTDADAAETANWAAATA